MGSGASAQLKTQLNSGLADVYSRAAESAARSVGHETWLGRVAVPEVYLIRGAKISDTAKRAITTAQLADLAAFIRLVLAEVEIVEENEMSRLHGERLIWECVDMYSVCTYFVEPLTLPHLCSFVDLVSTAEAQPPTWFVSHAWSTPFAQTVSMLNFHMQSRDLLPTTTYWICTMCNDQHHLGQMLGRTSAFDI